MEECQFFKAKDLPVQYAQTVPADFPSPRDSVCSHLPCPWKDTNEISL